MKRMLLVLLLFPVFARTQIITTVAGNGTNIYSGDGGLATAAAIGTPDDCVFDANNDLFITDVQFNVVRKVTPDGIIHTIAGTGTGGYNGDNIPATTANLSGATELAIDKKGNIYVTELSGSRVRKIDAVTGIITTVAGNGTWGYGGDGGPATASILYNPSYICFDKVGNLYISDPGNARIRKIDTFGIITTVAGNGVAGNSGDGTMATMATIEDMLGICTDNAGNIYFAEEGTRVRKVTVSTGIISTIAGIDTAGDFATGDGGPATAAAIDPNGLAFDKAGNLYISGYLYNDVRMIDNAGTIHTVAGTGTAGFTGDGGQSRLAKLSTTFGIAFDTCGNLFITDRGNNRIREVAFNPSCLPQSVRPLAMLASTTNIYPNPVKLFLTISSPDGINTISIINLLGHTISSNQYNSSQVQVDVAELPAGVYFIKINGSEVRKFVKQ